MTVTHLMALCHYKPAGTFATAFRRRCENLPDIDETTFIYVNDGTDDGRYYDALQDYLERFVSTGDGLDFVASSDALKDRFAPFSARLCRAAGTRFTVRDLPSPSRFRSVDLTAPAPAAKKARKRSGRRAMVVRKNASGAWVPVEEDRKAVEAFSADLGRGLSAVNAAKKWGVANKTAYKAVNYASVLANAGWSVEALERYSKRTLWRPTLGMLWTGEVDPCQRANVERIFKEYRGGNKNVVHASTWGRLLSNEVKFRAAGWDLGDKPEPAPNHDKSTVQWIFRKRYSNQSLDGMVKEMRREGFTNRQGRPYRRCELMKILADERYVDHGTVSSVSFEHAKAWRGIK